MNKHKYFFRGVGVTLIITATIFYFIGLNISKSANQDMTDEDIITKARELGIVDEEELKEKEFTDEEIILKAKKLGMIFPTNNEEEDKLNDDKEVSDELDGKEVTDKEKNDTKESDTVEIKIKYGMSSRDVAKLLFDNGIIDDIDECDKYFMVNNIDGKIKIGTYEFKLNSTYEEVMKIFTN